MATPQELPTLGNRYQLLSPIGRGGMGTVYLAHDHHLERDVAIKILASADDENLTRFQREARVAGSLNHPNIAGVLDYGVHDDKPFIVMELLEGEPLSRLLGGPDRIAIATTLRILTDVAEALNYAHERAVIHRDIKPANIFLTKEGKAKILDFGVAKRLNRADEGVTIVGFVVGTPYYMSPEQIEGGELDPRSDLFSLGAVAFEMLTGEKPFDGKSPLATMHQVVHENPPPVSQLRPGCPPELDDLVLQCLRKYPGDRPTSASDVLSVLTSIARTIENPGTWPVPASEPAPPLIPVSTPMPQPPGLVVEGGTMVGPILKDQTLVQPSRPGPKPPPPPPPHRAPAPSPASRALEPGTKIDRFIVHELVAQGQTGHLYKAFDPVRSEIVGLKVIDDRSTTAVGRLLRASRNWVRLRHENLQTILEVHPGDDGKPALVVTELIEGRDLGRVMEQQTLELSQKIEIVIQVCRALEYMHSNHVVHREIKPRNIVIARATMKATVLDSGLARSTDTHETSFTQTGIAVGDLSYMAPEQARGRCDERSDIYSIGAVLYELTMGQKPLALNPAAMLAEIAKADLPDKLKLALRLALQEDINERYSTVPELVDQLRALVPEELPPLKLSDIVVTLHGIRTQASWQRAFSEVATRAGLHCRLDRWNFGYFSVFRFLSPWSRQAKVSWFRSTYHDEFAEHLMSPLTSDRPSIVAHSFGTYVLGNALLRYPFLRFNRVLLCGSILPKSFPWDAIIERGQVQVVRNEYGARDVWTNLVQWFIPGTGPSGITGFTVEHKRFEQESFDYSHSEYFDRGHMKDRWIPFFKRPTNANIKPHERTIARPRSATPWGLFALYALIASSAAGAWYWFLR